MTDCEGKYDSEMNIAIEHRKAMCECTLLEFRTQCEPEVTGLEQCDSGTCNFTSLNASFQVSIPATDCLEL